MTIGGKEKTTRGRGMKTRGRGCRVGYAIDAPSRTPSHSLGATFTKDPSADDGGQSTRGDQSPQVRQSSPTLSFDDSQSIEEEASADPQPTEMPSVEELNTEVDRRLVVKVACVTEPRRFVPARLTREIIGNVILRMPYPAENWSSYCPLMKEQLFKDFEAKYRFATDYDLRMAKDVWNRTCFDRYSDVLAKARAKAFNDAKSMNFADLKGRGPKGMRTDVWDGLVDIWMKPVWQKKSIAGKSNRASKPECMVHTGGSRSFGDHKRIMEIELKRPVSYKEVYAKVHKKKNGEFISEKSKNFTEFYEDAMVEKYGEDTSTHPQVDFDLWLQVGGENKKGRIHGLGHSLELSAYDSTQASSSDVVGPSHGPSRNEDMTIAINAALSNLMPQVQAQIKEQVQVEMRAQADEVQALKEHVQANTGEVQALKEQVQVEMRAQTQICGNIMEYLKTALPTTQGQAQTSRKR